MTPAPKLTYLLPMGRRSSSSPCSIPNVAQPLEVESRVSIGNAQKEVAGAVLCVAVLLERGEASEGKFVDDLGGRGSGPEEDAGACDRPVEFGIPRNLNAGISTSHCESVPARGFTYGAL